MLLQLVVFMPMVYLRVSSNKNNESCVRRITGKPLNLILNLKNTIDQFYLKQYYCSLIIKPRYLTFDAIHMIKLLLFVAWWTCSIGFILRSCRFFRQNKELLSRYEVQSTNTDDDPSMFTGPLFEGDVVEYIIEDSDRSRKGPMLGAISVSGPSSSVIKINQLCTFNMNVGNCNVN